MLALLVVAVSVGLDNFGAATVIGVTAPSRRSFARVVVTFGLFEGAMPVLGIVLGRDAAGGLGGSAHVLAGGVLCAAGAYTLVADRLTAGRPAPHAGMGAGRLTLLAAVLSLDNLAIGFGLGADRVPIVLAAVVLGAVSALLSLLGLELGRRLRGTLGRWSEAVGGVVLLGVGAAILAAT